MHCTICGAEFHSDQTCPYKDGKEPPNPPLPVIVFDKTYNGFEDAADIDRDISEAFDHRFNPNAANIPGEFQGRMRVLITYYPSEDDPT